MSDWVLMRNLIKAVVVWGCAIFSLFMRLFLVKYLPGDIFVNEASAAIAAMVSALLCIGIDKGSDKKNILSFLFTVLCVGSIILLVQYKSSWE